MHRIDTSAAPRKANAELQLALKKAEARGGRGASEEVEALKRERDEAQTFADKMQSEVCLLMNIVCGPRCGGYRRSTTSLPQSWTGREGSSARRRAGSSRRAGGGSLNSKTTSKTSGQIATRREKGRVGGVCVCFGGLREQVKGRGWKVRGRGDIGRGGGAAGTRGAAEADRGAREGGRRLQTASH
eukprot:2671762-Rhodomonas_salina.1